MGFWKKKQPLSTPDLLHDLDLLAKAEAQIAKFYARCGEIDSGDRDFWLQLADNENQHHDLIRRMSQLVTFNPNQYRPGNDIKPGAIRLFRMQVTDLIGQISAETSHRQLLEHAAQLENSAAGLGLEELIATTDEEFKRLAQAVADESAKHRNTIEKKLATLNAI
ncbi:MAG: hypothetical protein C0616_12125 [Desulfuromonas sp.]|nr:MAG: hypothetical protein C0616_12125 [Desulfuromonas sp.]